MPHLDQLQQLAAHEPVGVEPDPHLYAQLAFTRLASRYDPPVDSFFALDPYGKSIVGPLHHTLGFSRRSRTHFASGVRDKGGRGLEIDQVHRRRRESTSVSNGAAVYDGLQMVCACVDSASQAPVQISTTTTTSHLRRNLAPYYSPSPHPRIY